MEGEKTYQIRLIIDLSLQCLSGLAYAHSKGLYHRDIKPENCLVADVGRPRLNVGDFGIAAGLSRSDSAVAREGKGLISEDDGSSIGTPSYMPPEQWSRQYGAIGPWSDIYAFGVMLFELCTNERPFDEGSEPSSILKMRHLGSPAPDPRKIRTDIPPRLADFIVKCLSKSPGDRFQSCDEASRELIGVHRDFTGDDYPEEEIKAVKLLAGTLSNRGMSLIDLGKCAEAIEVLSEAIALDPGNLHAVYNHGLLSWHMGKISDSAFIERLDAVNTPMVREKAYMRGLINRERGDDEAALADLTTAEKNAPPRKRSRSSRKRGKKCAKAAAP